jgi:hypothetical protein
VSRHDRTRRRTTKNPNTATATSDAYPTIRTRAVAYSGTCDKTMMRGSVISSIANRRPSRPKPESFDPP